jgi:hypothetical protein
LQLAAFGAWAAPHVDSWSAKHSSQHIHSSCSIKYNQRHVLPCKLLLAASAAAAAAAAGVHCPASHI